MENGSLVKLTIEAYDRIEFDHDSTIRLVDDFTVMFNPEKYTRRYQVEYEDNNSRGRTANSQKFKGIKEQEFRLEFTMDGTGVATAASGERVQPIDLQAEIDKLVNMASLVEPDSHRTRFLKVFWGALVIRCVLGSLDINYTLFHPDGSPLRAKITMQFKEVKSDERRTNENRVRSSDLTHIRLMRKGERIDNMTFEKYRDPAFYIQVARFNGLNNFRRPMPGLELRFPPIVNRRPNE